MRHYRSLQYAGCETVRSPKLIICCRNVHDWEGNEVLSWGTLSLPLSENHMAVWGKIWGKINCMGFANTSLYLKLLTKFLCWRQTTLCINHVPFVSPPCRALSWIPCPKGTGKNKPLNGTNCVRKSADTMAIPISVAYYNRGWPLSVQRAGVSAVPQLRESSFWLVTNCLLKLCPPLHAITCKDP